MQQLKTLHHIEQEYYEDDNDYDDAELLLKSRSYDWQVDRLSLGLDETALAELPKWLDEQKQTFSDLGDSQDDEGPSVEDLNAKQLVAYNIVKRHIEKAKEVGLDLLPQLLLNISGGAGTGKTFWLNAVRKFARTSGMSHFIRRAAPSGTAAFLIGGETLHSLLCLPIGTAKLEPLGGERLMELQRKFQDVGILMIDEKSMMGQEMFWMVNERLKEAKPHHQDKPFGNLSIVLLGDWKQLPPVADSSLYDFEAKNPRGFNLYQLFDKVVIFDVVQRQSGDEQQQFRTDLASLAEGTFALDTWKRWRSRALDLLPPPEREVFYERGVLACALKKDMVKHNMTKVISNKTPVAPIKAISTPKAANALSSEQSSGLLSNLILSKNTTFRLTSNLWTKAGLTNGSEGKVRFIIYAPGEQPPSLPAAIIATFEEYRGPPYLPDLPKSVPIVPVRREWFSNKIHCTRTMLPMILGYALSIHKLQGATCDYVILNPGKKEFASGLLLVGATRTKTFETLAFAPYPNFSRFQQVR